MDRTTQALSAWEAGLSMLGRRVLAQSWRPGTTPEAVAGALAPLDLASTEELAALFAWHDGTEVPEDRAMDDYQVFPGFLFLPLADSVRHCEQMRSHPSWESSWFPILTDTGGYFFVVDLASGGAVRRFRFDDFEHRIEHLSITDMVETLTAAMSRGVIFVDESGYLEMNDEEYARLRQEPTQ